MDRIWGWLIIVLASCAAPKAGEPCEKHYAGACADKTTLLLCETHGGKDTWAQYECTAGCNDNGRSITCDLSKNEPGPCAPTAVGWQQCQTNPYDGSTQLAVCYAYPNTPNGDSPTATLAWQECTTCDANGCTP